MRLNVFVFPSNQHHLIIIGYKQTMSDTEEEVPSTRPYAIERAKTGRASCKKCKNSLPAKEAS